MEDVWGSKQSQNSVIILGYLLINTLGTTCYINKIALAGPFLNASKSQTIGAFLIGILNSFQLSERVLF